MSAEEKFQKFICNIEEWMSGHNIIYSFQKSFDKHKELKNIIECTGSDYSNFTIEQCQDAMILLNQYCTYLNIVLSREKASKIWADQGLNYILAGKTFDKYTKWEEKKALILKEGSISVKLQELKTICETRIMLIESQIKNIEFNLKILESIWRNKNYERIPKTGS